MPGMSSGLDINAPAVIAAFHAALARQGLVALLIFALLGLAWVSVRAWLPGDPLRHATGGAVSAAGDSPPREPVGRKVLRIGFGLLWLFDGILQTQPTMAIGLPSHVIKPSAAGSPAWVQHMVNWAGTTWSYHPLQASTAAVWIQLGIGVWLLAAARGPLSRLAGLVSVGWSLVVWVFGESFGGIFAPGLTWLFGAPGAVAFYGVAGALLALPDRCWLTPRLGRLARAGTGLFLVGMAVLQAWPGRGFWQGIIGGHPGTLAGMTQEMAQTPQPRPLSGLVTAFAGFDEAHGFAVNLFVVVTLALIGAAFLTRRPRLTRPALVALTVVCLADWVLIQDFGVFGGLATDPNSMIPFALLATGGYLAPVRVPAGAPVTASLTVGDVPGAQPARGWARWQDWARPARLRQMAATVRLRSVAATGALSLVILGAAPMAIAQASPNADPILAEAIGGSSGPVRYPAPRFALTSQHSRTVTLASLRGKVVLLTFLDPVCTTDCPLIGQEFRYAAQLLDAASRRVELVAITLSPTYRSVAVLRAFDRQEGLAPIPNWLFLTGTLPKLRQVWHAYGMTAYNLPAGAMSAHNDQAFVIDRTGHVREVLNTEPGPGTAATKSSFAVLLADAAQRALRSH